MRRTIFAVLLVGAAVVPGATAVPRGASPWLMFASTRTGTSQIYAVSADGERLRQLTFGAPGASSPAPSPDGSRIAIVRGGGLWLIAADGSRPRLFAPSSNSAAAWSPNGYWIAYVDGGIRLRPRYGGQALVYTRGNDAFPTWSPDGKRLAWVRSIGGRTSLIVLADGNETTVAEDVQWRTSPWSPAGNLLAYATYDGFFVVTPDGRTRRRMGSAVPSFGTAPAWSPDGTRLALGTASGLLIADPATGEVRTLVPKGPISEIAWTPNGSAIAYSEYPADDLHLVTLDGRDRRVIAVDDGTVLSGLAWTTPPLGTSYRAPERVRGLVVAHRDELLVKSSYVALASHGDEVALVPCGRVVFVWRPRATRPLPLGAPGPNACRPKVNPGGITELAYAGGRLSYWLRQGGIGVFGTLLVRDTAPTRPERRVVEISRCCSGDLLRSERWGNLLGGEPLLVFATWEFCTPCDDGSTRVRVEDLWRVTNDEAPDCAGKRGTCVRIAHADGPLVPLDVSGRRILVRRADGTLALLDERGNLLRTFATTAFDAKLVDGTVVARTTGAIEQFDQRSGKRLRAWPLPSPPAGGRCLRLPYPCRVPELRLLGATGRSALYLLQGELHLLRLRDGLDEIVGYGDDGALTQSGAFIVYSGAKPFERRVAFIPTSRLPAGGGAGAARSPSARGSVLDVVSSAELEFVGRFAGDSGFGTGPAAAGDVNGDGLADFVVGQQRDGLHAYYSGAAYVVFGRRERGVIDAADLGGGGFRIDGRAAYAGLGADVAGVGDVNDDGFDDVAVAGRGFGSDSATVFVVFGGRSSEPVATAALGARGFRIDGADAVARAGDVNGDGHTDLLVRSSPRAAVVFGSAATEPVDARAPGRRGFVIEPPADRGVGYGDPLTGGRDVNGDGLADLAVVASSTGHAATAYVVYGKRSTDDVRLDGLGVSGFAISHSAGTAAGESLAMADANGDGLADLVVGEPWLGYDQGPSGGGWPGGVAVVFGARSSGDVDTAKLDGRGFRIAGSAYGGLHYAGERVANVGDVSGDGIEDVFVGGADWGRIVYGARSTATVELARSSPRVVEVRAQGRATLVAGGDVNGDGRSDLIAGVPSGGNNGFGSGTAYVLTRDLRPPVVAIAARRAAASRVRVVVSCNEACTITASGGARTRAPVFLARGVPRSLELVDRGRRPIRVRAVDRSGNATVRSVRPF